MDGVVRQATTGMRFSPRGDLVPVILVNDGKARRPGQSSYAVLDPKRQAQLRNLGPTWR